MADKVGEAPGLEGAPHGRADHAAMAGDVDPGVGGKHAHGSNLVETAYRSLGSTAHRVG